MDYTSIKKWLKENLTEERYLHSLGTAECAAELAEKYGVNKEKAYLAGLIHDCAKCLKKEELLDILHKMENIHEDEFINPKTYHAPAGVPVAKKEFNITDEEILSALRWHTLGKENMTDFEKIIFIADKIEPKTRTEDYVQPIREALKEENGLNKALFICYKNTIKSLVDRNLRICPQTITIYNELLSVL